MKTTVIKTLVVNARRSTGFWSKWKRTNRPLRRGYTAVKVVCVPYSEPLMSTATVKKLSQAFERLRQAVGDEIDLPLPSATASISGGQRPTLQER